MFGSKETLKEIFPLKRCKHNFNKKSNKNVGPCLYYHIGRCLGPCINEVALSEYRSMINQIVLFLEGKTDIVKEYIKENIDICIKKLEFEKAKELHERLEKITKITEKQKEAVKAGVLDILKETYDFEEEDFLSALSSAHLENDLIRAGLVYFFYSSANCGSSDLGKHSREKTCIKCHKLSYPSGNGSAYKQT